MDKRSFYAPDIDVFVLGQALHDWFAGQNYQTQILPSESGAVTVQARKEDALRTIAGMSTALTAVIVSDGETISVEMGNAKWTDKAVVGGVGVLLFPPALITAGIGLFQQSQIQSNAWKFIENHIRTNSAFSGMMPGGALPNLNVAPPRKPTAAQPPRPVTAAAAAPVRQAPPPLNLAGTRASPGGGQVVYCTSCKQPLRGGAKFCDNCGAPAPVANNCKSCGKPLRPGARFCDECGTPV